MSDKIINLPCYTIMVVQENNAYVIVAGQSKSVTLLRSKVCGRLFVGRKEGREY